MFITLLIIYHTKKVLVQEFQDFLILVFGTLMIQVGMKTSIENHMVINREIVSKIAQNIVLAALHSF